MGTSKKILALGLILTATAEISGLNSGYAGYNPSRDNPYVHSQKTSRWNPLHWFSGKSKNPYIQHQSNYWSTNEEKTIFTRAEQALLKSLQTDKNTGL